jgi:hypothetical protein
MPTFSKHQFILHKVNFSSDLASILPEEKSMTKKILAVLAHPDDETFGLGGTIAYYNQKGVETYYVCATRGEVGAADEEFMQGFKDTAEMRTDELMRAAKILGLKEVHFLGYRDSGMPNTEPNQHPNAQVNHPIEEVAGKVVKYTTFAFANADNPTFYPEAGEPFKPKALYYQVFPKTILKVAVRLLPLFGKDPTKFGRNEDINLKELVAVDFPVHVRLNINSVTQIKRHASEQHASQGGKQMRRGIQGLVMKLFGEHEDFMQAYPPVGEKFKRKSDLFEGT